MPFSDSRSLYKAIQGGQRRCIPGLCVFLMKAAAPELRFLSDAAKKMRLSTRDWKIEFLSNVASEVRRNPTAVISLNS